MLDRLMLACCNFLPHSCAPVATPLGSFKDQDYSLVLRQSVYFSLIKIQCLLLSKAEDFQIQDIWFRLPNKPDATDRNISLLCPWVTAGEELRRHLCALSLWLISGYIISLCHVMPCKLGDPGNTAKDCKNSNLKICPSELHTVGTRVV